MIEYQPRELFVDFHKRKERFACLVAHRRAGKTVACIADLLLSILFKTSHHNPRGAYIAPLYRQAKSVAWDYLKDMTKGIPGVKINEAELRVDFSCDRGQARIQLFGGDSPDSLRGQYFDAIVLDEYAQMSPRLWTEIIRPALADREGTATVIGTPMGHNIFYDLYQKAIESSEWFTRVFKASDTGLIKKDELAAMARELTEEEYAQEMECSWQAAIRGAYFGKQMAQLEAEGHITNVPYDETMKVITSWDLGINDSTVVWFWQVTPFDIRALDCMAFQSTGLPEIIRAIGEKPYIYSQHIAPHDIEVRELGSGLSRIEIARGLGINFDVAPKLSITEGINAIRSLLPKIYFDKEKCKDGIEALMLYRTEYDDKRNVFKSNPLHDYTSDYVDSVRYFAVTRHKTGVSDDPYADYSISVNG